MLNTLIQNKKKDISRKKNTIGPILVSLRMVEEEKKEKVSEIWISTQVCIICNIHKI